MDYSIKDLYASTLSALMADYGKVLQTNVVHLEHYGVVIERTQNFTILWDARKPVMSMLAVYDWNTHIALDLSDGDAGFSNENKLILENFFWFADEVLTVPAKVMEYVDSNGPA